MLIIGISGGSGSGKTSFINDLRENFSDQDISLLSQDEYYKDRDLQHVDHNGVRNFDLPEALDLDRFYEDIKALKEGKTVLKKEYTFNNADKEPRLLKFEPANILIVEGLFIFYRKDIFKLLDVTIMINASDAHKVIRRIVRDRIERNYPLEDVLYRYQNHVMPSFKEFILPYMDKVDIVINNNHSYKNAIRIITGFIKNYLYEQKLKQESKSLE